MSDQLPTKEDLEKLSLRGMVCYAVRNAMRVDHITKPYNDLYEKVQDCLNVATTICTVNDVALPARAAARAADTAANAVDVARADATRAAVAVARTVAAAAGADATRTAARATEATAYANAATAADVAAYAAIDAASATADAVAAARVDYEKLLKLTGHQAGQFGDPIDPSESGLLGSLWPAKNEEHSKAVVLPDSEPVIKVFFDESSGLTEYDQLLFLKYLNALHEEQKGTGLIITDEKRFQVAKERVVL